MVVQLERKYVVAGHNRTSSTESETSGYIRDIRIMNIQYNIISLLTELVK